MESDPAGSGAEPRRPGLLERLRGSELARTVLYDIDHFAEEGEPVDWPLSLPSGAPLTWIGSASTGSAYLLCGTGEHDPVVYYEGDGGYVQVLGRDLTEALELLIGVPDLLDLEIPLRSRGVEEAAAQHERSRNRSAPNIPDDSADHPRDWNEVHALLAAELGVRALPVRELLQRFIATSVAPPDGTTLLWEDMSGEFLTVEHWAPEWC
ncbi:hypothetical protein O4J56_01695 [Nocardiopsis sp. RSe5-2]|uniref:SUKH-4 immunity protein of toxin-antitoxin system n=1 Tax=Nocardiopsis endophytica TaxID=3018445 RepID=A0ABT4TXB6_9ACTN|nr:hypothetical protein [Nocardiopsis endophytica]MDA2809338.1 hypothetical protein [Nocardiopsis endophytica]